MNPSKKRPKKKLFQLSLKQCLSAAVLIGVGIAGLLVVGAEANNLSVDLFGKTIAAMVKPVKAVRSNLGSYEISRIKTSPTTAEAAGWYRKLIEKVGPSLAQDDLNNLAKSTGPMHLVNHTVGSYLYEKYGSGGIAYCKEYFSGSCYHGVLLNFMGTPQQDSEIGKALVFCKQKGMGIPKACSHAIGHGVLAQVGYKNLPAAIAECNRMATVQPLLSLIDCQDGVFMENIFGVHEGKPSPDRWVKADDLTYPCSDPIFANYQSPCWRNQIDRISEVVGRNYPKMQQYCDALKSDLRATCYNNIYRQILTHAKNNLTVARQDCSQLSSELGGEYCVMNVAAYNFYQGDSKIQLDYCNHLTGSLVPSCFKSLVEMMKMTIVPAEQPNYCNRIEPAEWRDYCQSHRTVL